MVAKSDTMRNAFFTFSCRFINPTHLEDNGRAERLSGDLTSMEVSAHLATIISRYTATVFFL